MHLGKHVLMAALASVALASCRLDQALPMDERSLVGDYIYQTQADVQHEPERLTLRADGRYVLTRGAPGQSQSRREGAWRLILKDPPDVALDDAGYPIQMNGSEIRLLINDDLGQWYAKVK
jgi:hypothetical protein